MLFIIKVQINIENMIRSYRNEMWKEILFDNKISEKEKFKISALLI
ncbi:hypothetical protein [Tenacibaculum finnmarkense]|nr:hypothetical protein [Tenacibaculum finnmarkense]